MKILIFTASAGNGHNSTAQKLKMKVLSKHPNAEIKIVDMYKTYASKLKAWTMSKGYALACNHIVGIYNYFFKKSEKSDYENRDKSKANHESYCIMYGMLKEIYDYKPDIVVSTYIFGAVALTNLRRYYKIPATVVCMTLDYGISPYWECATAMDEMFLTDFYMKNQFLKRGFSEKQLVVSGIPIDDGFSKKETKENARKILGLEDRFTLLVSRASFFPLSTKKLVNEFKKIKTPIQIVVWNGKDKKAKKSLDKILAKNHLIHDVKNFGFVDDLPMLFSAGDAILMKAGGLTTTEALTKSLPMILLDKLPQQEVHNKEYLVKMGVALSVDKQNSISQNVSKLLTDKKLYAKMQKNIQAIQKFNTLDVFLSHFENYKKADYSNVLNFLDTKAQVRHNVDCERKQTIKLQNRQKGREN